MKLGSKESVMSGLSISVSRLFLVGSVVLLFALAAMPTGVLNIDVEQTITHGYQSVATVQRVQIGQHRDGQLALQTTNQAQSLVFLGMGLLLLAAVQASAKMRIFLAGTVALLLSIAPLWLDSLVVIHLSDVLGFTAVYTYGFGAFLLVLALVGVFSSLLTMQSFSVFRSS